MQEAGRTETSEIASRTLLFASLLLAWYTGFRMPNRWSVTLYTTSLFDGFSRRFLVGTLLEPLARVTDYQYWLYAGVALAVLAALLGIVVWRAVAGASMGQRALVILWLLLPTGGFIFHEVGYLEQLAYLLLFVAIWLLNRQRLPLASLAMVLSVMVHENALLSVLPLFAFFALQTSDWRTTARAVAAPVVVAFGILVLPPTSRATVATHVHRLASANFVPRTDALGLFTRTQSQNWKLYDPWGTFRVVLPGAIALALAFFVISRRREIGAALGYTLLGVAAIAAPAFLSFGGGDLNRWEALSIANFLIVVWFWLERQGREITVVELLIVAAALIVATHNGIPYFDHLQPRLLAFHDIRRFFDQLTDGTLFRIPVLF